MNPATDRCKHRFRRLPAAAECPDCGQIRLERRNVTDPTVYLTANTAPLVERALVAHLAEMWDLRAEEQRNGGSTTDANREIRHLTDFLKAVTAVKEAFGWT